MSPTAVALLAGLLGGGGLGAIIVAYIQAKSKGKADMLTAMSARIKELEDWRSKQENRYSSLWAYCRRLIDYAYKHRRDGSPDLPDIPDDLT